MSELYNDKNVSVLECKQTKINTNRVKVFNSPFHNKP